MPEIIRQAAARKMRIYFNPAPMSKEVLSCPLELVHTLIVNEREASALASCSENFHSVLTALRDRYPKQNVLMTLGVQDAV